MAKPQKPASIEGTKVRRRHATPAKSWKQMADEREAEQAARDDENYGGLLGDINYLRRKFAINREGGLIRVGGTLRTEAQVREIAARERRLEQPEPAMLAAITARRIGQAPPASAASSSPAKILPRPAIESLKCERCGEPRTDDRATCKFCRDDIADGVVSLCPCGRPANHYGRCWHRRGLSAPGSKEPAERSAVQPKLCSCGEPLGDRRATRCRKCYLAADRASQLPADKLGKLRESIAQGDGPREAARKAGVSPSTAFRRAEKETPEQLRCGCGKPSSHSGRCWFRRGLPGPSERGLKVAAGRARLELKCEKCGGPRSPESVRFCRDCYVGAAKTSDFNRNDDLVARVAALEAKVAELAAQVDRDQQAIRAGVIAEASK